MDNEFIGPRTFKDRLLAALGLVAPTSDDELLGILCGAVAKAQVLDKLLRPATTLHVEPPQLSNQQIRKIREQWNREHAGPRAGLRPEEG